MRSRSRSRSKRRIPRSKFKVMAYKEHKGDDFSDYVGWLASEKYDGWQVLLDDSRMLTKSQKLKFTPPFMLNRLRMPLAGELVIEGSQAHRVASLLNPKSKLWNRSRVHVFDTIGPGTFAQRSARAKRQVKSFCKGVKRCPLRYIPQRRVRSHAHVKTMLHAVKSRGGEGLVLTQPSSLYKRGRSRSRVKIKPRHDAEGLVISKKMNKNGTLKSLRLRPFGRFRFERFFLGTGFTHYQRKNHNKLFPIGTVVTFSYRSLTSFEKPKEARFLRVRKSQ